MSKKRHTTDCSLSENKKEKDSITDSPLDNGIDSLSKKKRRLETPPKTPPRNSEEQRIESPKTPIDQIMTAEKILNNPPGAPMSKKYRKINGLKSIPILVEFPPYPSDDSDDLDHFSASDDLCKNASLPLFLSNSFITLGEEIGAPSISSIRKLDDDSPDEKDRCRKIRHRSKNNKDDSKTSKSL